MWHKCSFSFFLLMFLPNTHDVCIRLKHRMHSTLMPSLSIQESQTRQTYNCFFFAEIRDNIRLHVFCAKYFCTRLISIYKSSFIISGIFVKLLCTSSIPMNFLPVIAPFAVKGETKHPSRWQFIKWNHYTLATFLFLGKPITVTSAPFGLPRFSIVTGSFISSSCI